MLCERSRMAWILLENLAEVILMWVLPSAIAIPIGNPFVGLSLVEIVALCVMVLAGGTAVLLARVTRGGRKLRIVRCPTDGARARIVMARASPRSPTGVAACSRWRVRSVSCDQSCLPRAA
jgi:hypothetical protein